MTSTSRSASRSANTPVQPLMSSTQRALNLSAIRVEQAIYRGQPRIREALVNHEAERLQSWARTATDVSRRSLQQQAAWHPYKGGPGFLARIGYDDVQAVSRDSATWSSRASGGTATGTLVVPEAGRELVCRRRD
jgi:hypothetical protein